MHAQTSNLQQHYPNIPTSNIELINENQSKLNNNLVQSQSFQQLQNQKFVKQETLINEQRKNSRNLAQHYISQQEFYKEKDVEQQLLALNMNQNREIYNTTSNNTKSELIRMLLEMTPAEVFFYFDLLS